MKKYFILFLITAIIFVVSGHKIYAQQVTGCNFNGYIYYTPDGTSGGNPNYKKSPPGQRIATNLAYCVVNIGGNCRIDKKGNQTGTLVTFYFVQCPIDDYIPLFMLIIGGLGFSMIRNNRSIRNLA